MSANAGFGERRRELEALLGELDHDTWKRGLAVDEKLTGELPIRQLAPRQGVQLLVGSIFHAAEARLRTIAGLADRLSDEERGSLAGMMRLPASERLAMARILRLEDKDRDELATALALTDGECSALAAFVDDAGGAAVTERPGTDGRGA